jgi:hypothetical protein
MRLFSFLKGGKQQPSFEALRTRQTDAFADSVALELKSVTSNAIRLAVEQRESRYMKAILDESYFVLDSLVISPTDRDIASKFEDFLSAHDAVDPDFRRKFFQQILQREYRSGRGSCVRVPLDFEPTVHVAESSLDGISEEEGFRISLKGRKIQFAAAASLGGPLRREGLSNTTAFVDHAAANHTAIATERGGPEKSVIRVFDKTVNVSVTDGNGNSNHILRLPAVIGREPIEVTAQHECDVLRLNAVYVSRHQLMIFEILGEVLYFVPQASSLSCLNDQGKLLERGRIVRLDPDASHTLRLGVSADQLVRVAPSGPPSEYAVITLSLARGAQPDDGTPRPRATP